MISAVRLCHDDWQRGGACPRALVSVPLVIAPSAEVSGSHEPVDLRPVPAGVEFPYLVHNLPS